MSKQSDAIRLYFKSNGYKQKDVAEALGLTPANLSNILHGGRAIGPSIAHRMHDVYGFSIAFIITGEGDLFGPSSKPLSISQTDVKVGGDNIVGSVVSSGSEDKENTLLKMVRDLLDQVMQLKQENCDLKATIRNMKDDK